MSAGNDISHLQSLDLRRYKYLLQKSKSATRFTSDLKQHVSPIYMGVFCLHTFPHTLFYDGIDSLSWAPSVFIFLQS